MLEIGSLQTRDCTGTSRRCFLKAGMTLPFLPGLLQTSAAFGAEPAKARSVMLVWLNGGPSHLDLFDPKPKLADHKKIPIKLPRITRDATPNCRPSPFRFQQHGESGTWFSELMPYLSRHADDLCIVRSVYCDQIEHSGAIRQMTTGDGVLPRPSVGAWSLYGPVSYTHLTLPTICSV